jgi:hypothetical protein
MDTASRLLPPKCKDMHDWVTLWSCILTIVSFFVMLAAIFFLPDKAGIMVTIFMAVGSFTLGRTTIQIAPKK